MALILQDHFHFLLPSHVDEGLNRGDHRFSCFERGRRTLLTLMREPGCFNHLQRNEGALDVYTEVRYRWNMKSHEHAALQDQRGKAHITPVHPGDVLKDELEEIELTQTALAHHIGVLPKPINEICRGKRGISADMAMKLSKALGGSPQFWLNLQNN